MDWPSPQDYNEAVQTPLSSFSDATLRKSIVETTPLGLPRCVSGNFASVYCMEDNERKIAVRCFLHNVPDQEHRYSQISNFVMNDDLPYTVPFEYIKKGIKVRGEWYPVMKMHWVEGVPLTQFVENNLQNSQALSFLASYFKQMTVEFHRAGIAHGDLQHDNILIADDELRLVDYDGMYVPALADAKATELGHRNYQHPQRSQDFFAPSLDNFSSWIIYASLKSLAIDPSLWASLQGGDDCLLLRHADFIAGTESPRLQSLLQHSDARISKFASEIQRFISSPVDAIPPIDAEAVGRALMVLPSVSEVTVPKDSEAQPEKSLVAITGDTTRAFALPSSQLTLSPGTDWSDKDEVLAKISAQLAVRETVTWSSPLLTNERMTTYVLSFVFIFCLFLIAVLPNASWVVVVVPMLWVWLLIHNKTSENLDRLYLLTTDRLVLVRSNGVESIPFDSILTVEENSFGASIVLLCSSGQAIAGKNFRSVTLDEDGTYAFFKALPKSVARRRL